MKMFDYNRIYYRKFYFYKVLLVVEFLNVDVIGICFINIWV